MNRGAKGREPTIHSHVIAKWGWGTGSRDPQRRNDNMPSWDHSKNVNVIRTGGLNIGGAGGHA